jgi:hypothetical protein
MPLYSKKQKHDQYQKLQCFHSGLLLFGFDYIICNPFSMVWAILFPFTGVENVAAAPCFATCGVLGVNLNILPPPLVQVLAVRSIQAGGAFSIGTLCTMTLIRLDTLLTGMHGLGVGGYLFQLGTLCPTGFSCHKFQL